MPPLSAYFRWLLFAVLYGSLMFATLFVVASQHWGDFSSATSSSEDLEICVIMSVLSTLMFLITTGPSEYAKGYLFAPLRMLLIGIVAFQLANFMAFFRR